MNHIQLSQHYGSFIIGFSAIGRSDRTAKSWGKYLRSIARHQLMKRTQNSFFTVYRAHLTVGIGYAFSHLKDPVPVLK